MLVLPHLVDIAQDCSAYAVSDGGSGSCADQFSSAVHGFDDGLVVLPRFIHSLPGLVEEPSWLALDSQREKQGSPGK